MANPAEKGLLAEDNWLPSRASRRHRFLRRIKSPLFKGFTYAVVLLSIIYISIHFLHAPWGITGIIHRKWAGIIDPLRRPVDPSIYSAVYPDHPNPKATEVAELMTELYDLFISMQYINADDVAFAPHTQEPVKITEAARYGLTKDVVDVMQMVPYYRGFPNWNFGSDAGEFLFWGEFHDMRSQHPDWYQTVVDPFYAFDYCRPDWQTTDTSCPKSFTEEDGFYMRAHYATMNSMGNHGSVMILDTKTYNMWFVSQEGGSVDPAFTQARIKESSNRNDLDQWPSRPAAELLRDLIGRFRSLEYIPGGLYGNGSWEHHLYKGLYISSGWPSNFNSTLFLSNHAALQEAEEQLYQDEEPLRKVREYEQGINMRQYMKNVEVEARKRLNSPTIDAQEREEIKQQLKHSAESAEREAKNFDIGQQSILDLLMEHERKLVEPEAAMDPESRRNLEAERDDLTRKLADVDFEARQQREFAQAMLKAEEVHPDVRKAFEERIKLYGY